MTLLWYLLPLIVLAFGIESIFRAVPLPSPYIEHADILADLDREFPAALALPVQTLPEAYNRPVAPPCPCCPDTWPENTREAWRDSSRVLSESPPGQTKR